MLAYKWYKNSGIPVVFLHGLLGSKHDWADCFAHLPISSRIRPLAIDLPFHADSQHISCYNFSESRFLLNKTLNQLIDEPFWLVGYSLGGRIALDYRFNTPSPNLIGIILEGTNIGLQSDLERKNRWENDCLWAIRFQTEPLEQVLTDWYQQPVFKQLSENQRLTLIKNRKQNNGEKIAQMLKATSLSKQIYFGQHNWQKITFLIGEQDKKFREIAEKNNLPYELISKAGHNTHWENPSEFIKKLTQIIESNKNDPI